MPRRLSLPPLPIDSVLPTVVERVTGAGSLVLKAPPGAGKTTRVPPALIAAGVDGLVVVAEPRRMAARAAARRIAFERGWRLGHEVGYQVRFDRRFDAATRILFVTEGILLRRLQSDPFLDGVGAVVFDEIHERSLEADLSLAMVRRVRRQARPELALVAMSATLDVSSLAEFLGGAPVPGAPVLEVEGRAHPVTVEHRGAEPSLPAAVAAGVREALSRQAGDVLVFLPGMAEIRRCADALGEAGPDPGPEIAILHGSLPPEEQDRVLAPRSGGRRVILATNVAESSLTVPGVGAVVDSGRARVLTHDPAVGLDRLETLRISRASADQRTGRAGREGPGLCLRLWTELEDRGLAPTELPEVARADLSGAILQLLAWGEPDARDFPWFEAPPTESLDRGEELLRQLGALGESGLTAAGRAMARLPVHPRLARLLFEAHRRGVLERAAVAAAVLSERDPFPGARRSSREGEPPPAGRSDLEPRIDALLAVRDGRPRSQTPWGPPSRSLAAHALRVAEQLARTTVGSLGSPAATSTEPQRQLAASLLEAFPDRLSRRRAPGSDRWLRVGGRGARSSASSSVRTEELALALEIDPGRRGQRSEGWVRLAVGVDREWLPPDRLTTVESVAVDRETGRVRGARRLLWLDLELSAVEIPVTDPATIEAALVEAARVDPESALDLGSREPEAGFLARLRWLAGERPELALPTFPAERLGELLSVLVAGRRSLPELARTPVAGVLRGLLTRDQAEALEREAPERLQVPSGSRIRLEYEPGRPPVLAVRIQELFGWRETPRLAGGRVRPLLHLLAPNGRPQQVTDDLAGFWLNVYPEVRRELRGRYPKHPWPEDPSGAAAWRPGRRR